MNSVKYMGIVACLVVGSLAGTACGDDLLAPAWRGDAGTTYQVWNFGSSGLSPAADSVTNGYGTPSASVTVGFFGSGWYNQFPPDDPPSPAPAGAHSGVWDIGAADGSIDLTIPGGGDASSTTTIWVQVTYYRDIMDAPTVSVTGASFVSSNDVLANAVASPWGTWRVYQAEFLLDPSAASQTISIVGFSNGSIVDQVIVDTQVVPEPATMGLLAAGLAAVAIRRRREKR